jgi:hypothetical protein
VKSRRISDVLLGLVVVGLVAIEALSPGSPAQTTAPTETFTHIDATLNDTGLVLSTHTVPAGIVEIAFVDTRTDRSQPARLDSVPPAVSMAPGTALLTLRVLRDYAISARLETTNVGGGSLSVVVPDFATSKEPEHQVTVEFTTRGATTPHRQSRREQPVIAFSDQAPPGDRAWTTTAAGATTVVVHNATKADMQCRVGSEGAVRVARGQTERRSVAAVARDVRYVVLDCGGTNQFDFWIA